MKLVSRWGAGTLLLLASIPALAQDYPVRAITIVVPYAPGGVTDTIARIIAPRLGGVLGQQVIVDNRSGGGGLIGTDHVAAAAPDGYTLTMMIESSTIAPGLYPNLRYDPVKSFEPITLLAKAPQVIVVHPSSQTGSFAKLMSTAKTAIAPLLYASSGNGTAHHLAMEQIKLATGVNFQHVPYKGGGQAILDLVAGHVPLGIIGVAPALSHIKAGKLKALAVTSAKRTPVLPGVPTVAESGLAGFETFNWFGLLAPAGTSASIINRLHDEVVGIMNDPALAERWAGLALEVTTSTTPADFRQFVVEDMKKWPPLIKAGHVKVD